MLAIFITQDTVPAGHLSLFPSAWYLVQITALREGANKLSSSVLMLHQPGQQVGGISLYQGFSPQKPPHPDASSALNTTHRQYAIGLVQAICQASEQKAPWSNILLLYLRCIGTRVSSERQAVPKQTDFTMAELKTDECGIVNYNQQETMPCIQKSYDRNF